MELDETKLQEVVEKIAYQQFGEEQIDDLSSKMGILNKYVQEQMQLCATGRQGEQSKTFAKKVRSYFVAHPAGEDWEQLSIHLSLEEAKTFLEETRNSKILQKKYPHPRILAELDIS